MNNPLVLKWIPKNLKRSQREAQSFAQTVTVTEGKHTRTVVFHFLGGSKEEVAKVDKWAITARPVRSNDTARGICHYKAVPAGSAAIQCDCVTLDPSGCVSFVPHSADPKAYRKKPAQSVAA